MSQRPAGYLVGRGSKPRMRAWGSTGVETAVRHAFFWLALSNAVGLWLAWLLLFPRHGDLLGASSYGRWMPIHLNGQLYGWTSLPLVAWIMRQYEVSKSRLDRWAILAVWLWSMVLAAGMLSWLQGQTSGKLFLDWAGSTRFLFALVMVFLWSLLVMATWRRWRNRGRLANASKVAGLVILGGIPPTLFWAAGRDVYPAVNPHSGGPTGMSLLGSTLAIVVVLLLLPIAQGQAKKSGHAKYGWLSGACWLVFAVQVMAVALVGLGDASHRESRQWMGLGSLTLWAVLVPLYYRQYAWPRSSLPWQRACFSWFVLLLLTGWLSFLPGVLDRLKFSSGLVAHAHLAMAGFLTCFHLFVIHLIVSSHSGRSWSPHWTFRVWNGATVLYVTSMWIAGGVEAADPSYASHPDIPRTALHAVRWLAGLGLFAASVCWWWRLTLGEEPMEKAWRKGGAVLT